ncbi:MAG: hypothetical protein M1830_010829 [Pleopsidium flavum]|nr:MAG: hypothetical protein M1830_010829 [Pleopsidium flavum]
MDPYLDFFNVMAYDFSGSWDTHAGHQANLFPSASHPKCTPFSTAKAVEYYTAHGVPVSKIVLGMPLYGREFMGNEGPGHAFSGSGEGSWEQGVWDYKALPRDGAVERVDREVGASWSYDEGRKVMVSYDNVEMARMKARFIRQNGLGGGMWWESSADKSGEESLIATVVGALSGLDGGKMDHSNNTLSYPESKYDNLRMGFPGE